MIYKGVKKVFEITIVEYERGWGSQVDETLYCDNEEEAKKYCDDFNKDNTSKTVPDWYMVASYRRLT